MDMEVPMFHVIRPDNAIVNQVIMEKNVTLVYHFTIHIIQKAMLTMMELFAWVSTKYL